MAGLNTEGLPDLAAQTLAALVPGALKVDVVTGAGVSTNIAVTGIATEDAVVAAILFTAGVPSKCAAVTISSAGNIKTTTDTSTKPVVVVWQDKSNG